MPDKTTQKPFGDLTGLVAVVTGSSSGIGRAIALEFARAGACIVVHSSRTAEAGELLAKEIREQGGAAKYLRCDFAREDELRSFVDAAWNAFGRVDIWVNNAGVDLLTGADARAGLPFL